MNECDRLTRAHERDLEKLREVVWTHREREQALLKQIRTQRGYITNCQTAILVMGAAILLLAVSTGTLFWMYYAATAAAAHFALGS